MSTLFVQTPKDRTFADVLKDLMATEKFVLVRKCKIQHAGSEENTKEVMLNCQVKIFKEKSSRFSSHQIHNARPRHQNYSLFSKKGTYFEQ